MELLRRFLYDPVAIATLAAHGIGPEDVEAKVADLLEYLERTKEEKPGNG